MKTSRHLKLLAAALVFVVGVGTLGFHYIEGWPWFDGFYMVITTLTTIGYQEVHPLSHAGRVFNVIIILGGVDRKSTRLNSSHLGISYAVFCLKKKKKT